MLREIAAPELVEPTHSASLLVGLRRASFPLDCLNPCATDVQFKNFLLGYSFLGLSVIITRGAKPCF